SKAPPEIPTLSLHDALPIFDAEAGRGAGPQHELGLGLAEVALLAEDVHEARQPLPSHRRDGLLAQETDEVRGAIPVLWRKGVREIGRASCRERVCMERSDVS